MNEGKNHVQNLSYHLSRAKYVGCPMGFRPFWMCLALHRPGPDIDFAEWLGEQYNVEYIPSVTMIGEGYMSFNLTGTILEFFATGLFLSYFHSRKRETHSLRHWLLYVFALTQSCSAIMYGIHKVLITTCFMMGLVVICIPNDAQALANRE